MEKLNLLNKYVEGYMSEQELDDITKELVKDHFEEATTKDKWKQLLNEKYGVKSFNESKDLPDFKKKTKTKVFYLRTLAGVAASVLIFLMFTLNFDQGSKSAIDNILSDNYSSPIQYRNKKGTVTISDRRQIGFEHYSDQNYAACALVLEKIISQENFVEDDHFYLGLSYLYQKDGKQAADIFSNILGQENLQRKDAVVWFLALALVEDGQFEKAKEYLNMVAKWEGNAGKTKKAKQARELLEIIKKEKTK